MKIERIWGYPSKNTFSIKPIADILSEEVTDGFWVDPFANNAKIATVTNDLNTDFDTDYHLDALEFLKMFPDCSVDGILYDPPYSTRQISEERDSKVTLKELGSKLGYSIATISNWENLKSAPDLYNVEDVATYFNLPMNVFIGEG